MDWKQTRSTNESCLDILYPDTTRRDKLGTDQARDIRPRSNIKDFRSKVYF